MSLEKSSIHFRENPDGYVEYLEAEIKSIDTIMSRAEKVQIQYKMDEEDVEKFTTFIQDQKALVDNNILILTKKFTDTCHLIRNKIHKALDQQQAIFKENHYSVLKAIDDTKRNKPSSLSSKVSASNLKEETFKGSKQEQVDRLQNLQNSINESKR